MKRIATAMQKRLQRVKRLVAVQEKLLLSERLHLQSLTGALVQARDEELKAIARLNEQAEPVVPPSLLVRRVAGASVKIRNRETLLSVQVEKTLDRARKERLSRKALEAAKKDSAQSEVKTSLQAAIDAYLGSSFKQDS